VGTQKILSVVKEGLRPADEYDFPFEAGIGVGFGNMGSPRLLLEAVSAARIVTALVMWSEIGIVATC
jgi:hypothetical protein